MSVQVLTQNSPLQLVLDGNGYSQDHQTIAQDGSRSNPLVFGTVMAKVLATQKWVPLTSLTATTGAAVPQGIYVGPDIAAADIVAGDVDFSPILVGGGVVVDENLITLENSLTLDSEFNPSDATNIYYNVTVRDLLAMRGIFVGEAVAISEQQS